MPSSTGGKKRAVFTGRLPQMRDPTVLEWQGCHLTGLLLIPPHLRVVLNLRFLGMVVAKAPLAAAPIFPWERHFGYLENYRYACNESLLYIFLLRF